MRRILLFTFPLGFVLLAWWLMTRPPVEPVHGGKPLSVWLQEINSLELEATTASGIKLTTSNAPVNAVQSIGPAAIPWLRHELQAQEPLLHRLVSHLPVEWIYRLKLYRWLTPPVSPNSSERHRRAALAALILGPEARSLVPELAALLNSGKGHNFQFLALGRMGPDGVLPLAVAVTNQETQFSALYALELTDASTVAAVPALLCVLTNGGGYPSIQDKFINARSASMAIMPTLAVATTHTNWVVRESARETINVLQKGSISNNYRVHWIRIDRNGNWSGSSR